MPTIFANTRDGDLQTTPNTLNFADARGFTGNAIKDTSSTSDLNSVAVIRFSGRGADTFRVHRSFLYFDCTSITAQPASATLKIYVQNTSEDGNIRVIKSTAFGLTTNGASPTDLADTDFDNVDFSTSYSNEATVSGTGQLSITLTSDALSDMASRDYLGLALVNNPYDYNNTAPTSGANHRTGIRYADYSEPTKYSNILNSFFILEQNEIINNTS
jgi:hypothetical protein